MLRTVHKDRKKIKSEHEISMSCCVFNVYVSEMWDKLKTKHFDQKKFKKKTQA